jgi:serine-type D-Ala-D-Ala carboxypeptidase
MSKNYDDFLKKNIDTEISNALKNQTFSACSLGFYNYQKEGINRKILNYGTTGLGVKEKKICEKTLFDLASLTKPLVTSMVCLFLIDKGIIKYDDDLFKFFKNLDSNKKKIKLIHLLTHTSGLPAHKPYFKELLQISFNSRWNYLLNRILSEKLDYVPGKMCVYSDLGFILLGMVLEIVTGEKVDIFWEKNILRPLKIESKLFFPKQMISEDDEYVETGICPWSKIKLKGLVNDDNCRALGGATGHAGLFGTISGVLSYIEKISLELQGNGVIFQFSKETIKDFFQRKKNLHWVNGFDTPSACFSSSGKYFSDMSFGHLGFTGTSFWMDIKMQCGIVLLTNRVLCGEDLKPIRKIRPLIHNLVMEYIKKTNNKKKLVL